MSNKRMKQYLIHLKTNMVFAVVEENIEAAKARVEKEFNIDKDDWIEPHETGKNVIMEMQHLSPDLKLTEVQKS